ncbi:hypothetical protein J6590_094736 [Homalodisca vitripennis]|nr:hypothetical protein J6590_085144 [Homalodisca vitripennis]KAG8324341.1 hypothetical protein J6590_094736 [Homalodisca vitripennis]
MDFTLDNTQKGRPCLIYQKHKYRLKRTLLNGDISWCCLGKNCGASVKTDSQKTVLTICNEKHSGPHPVTLRSLTPDSTRSLPVSESSLSINDSPSVSPLLSRLFNKKSLSDCGTQTEDIYMKTKDELIERINQLTHQQSCLVLQCQSMHLQLEQKEKEIDLLKSRHVEVRELAVQTDELPEDITDKIEPCQRCVILREETQNMIQTIRTLENENERLRTSSYERTEAERNTTGVSLLGVSESSSLHSSLPLSNGFSLLSGHISDTEDFVEIKKSKKKKRKTNKQNKYINKTQKYQTLNKSDKEKATEISHIPHKLHIFADSHGKNIFHLLEQKVSSRCEVFINACSGASLSHVLENTHSMTKNFTKDDTIVIMAGANDLSDITPRNNRPARVLVGQMMNFIMNHNHTNVIVVSMFHRHQDHWDSYINREVRRINMTLHECLEKVGASMVDVTMLGRRLFTQHGQHLNQLGKRVLSGMIAVSARKLRLVSTRRPKPVAELQSPPTCMDLSGPITLRHETYAAAVRSSDQPGTSSLQTTPSQRQTDSRSTEHHTF